MHWGRGLYRAAYSLCAVSIGQRGKPLLGSGRALAVRADGRFRHLGKADVASGANDGAIGAADVVEGRGDLACRRRRMPK